MNAHGRGAGCLLTQKMIPEADMKGPLCFDMEQIIPGSGRVPEKVEPKLHMGQTLWKLAISGCEIPSQVRCLLESIRVQVLALSSPSWREEKLHRTCPSAPCRGAERPA